MVYLHQLLRHSSHIDFNKLINDKYFKGRVNNFLQKLGLATKAKGTKENA
jgi:hypothetical protein